MPYAWKLMTSTVAEPMVPEVTKNLPVVTNGVNTFNKNFIGGNGVSMNISVPDPGITTLGAALDRNNTGNRSGYVSLVLQQYNKGIELNAVQQALDIKNERDQLITPRAQEFASTIQIAAVEEIARKAANAIVVTAGKEIRDLSSSVNRIRACRAYSDIMGCVNPMFLDNVVDTGTAKFLPDDIMKGLYSENSIGRLNTANWFQTPDIANYVQTLPSLGSGTTLKAAFTLTSGIATQVVFTVSGGTATLVGDFIAGTPFQINGVYNVDTHGLSTGTLRTFYVKDTVTAASNTVTVDLTEPIYSTLPQKNVSSNASVTATTASFLLEADMSYRRGIVWTKAAFAVGEASLADYFGAENSDIKDAKGINIKFSRGSLIADGLNFMRMDALMGFRLIRANFATTLFQKIT